MSRTIALCALQVVMNGRPMAAPLSFASNCPVPHRHTSLGAAPPLRPAQRPLALGRPAFGMSGLEVQQICFLCASLAVKAI